MKRHNLPQNPLLHPPMPSQREQLYKNREEVFRK